MGRFSYQKLNDTLNKIRIITFLFAQIVVCNVAMMMMILMMKVAAVTVAVIVVVVMMMRMMMMRRRRIIKPSKTGYSLCTNDLLMRHIADILVNRHRRAIQAHLDCKRSFDVQFICL